MLVSGVWIRRGSPRKAVHCPPLPDLSGGGTVQPTGPPGCDSACRALLVPRTRVCGTGEFLREGQFPTPGAREAANGCEEPCNAGVHGRCSASARLLRNRSERRACHSTRETYNRNQKKAKRENIHNHKQELGREREQKGRTDETEYCLFERTSQSRICVCVWNYTHKLPLSF